MSKLSSLIALVTLSLASSIACTAAHADRVQVQEPVVSIQQSPYSIELVDDRGRVLDTYQHRGRFYVEGESSSRYSIRVTNPTNVRVEAVVSVDGLDVIDGETANFKSKRGYIVPPHGSLVVDGFRVSTQSVAAFRFSSVSSSYAGRKGKARNVGVIGVAIFSERPQPQVIVHDRVLQPVPHRDTRLGSSYSGSDHDDAEMAPPSPSPARTSRPAITSGTSRHYKPAAKRSRAEERPGLGTSFGENRYSSVSFTQFQRANLRTPTAFAELRYNNANGLQALGIVLHHTVVDSNEVWTRETASAFPNSRFATPPR